MPETPNFSPDITVLMAARNAGRFIGAAVHSLCKQTLQPCEIIIVDDGSSDDTIARATDAGGSILRVIHQEHAGVGAARNRAVAAAKTGFVTFFDADDVAPQNRLAALAKPFSICPEVDLTAGRWCNFWDASVASEADDPAADAHKGEQSTIMLTVCMIRRELFERFGPFRTDVPYSSGQYWLNAVMDGQAVLDKTDDVVLRRRIHDRNMSRGKTDDDMLDLIRERLKHRKMLKQTT